ncbi:CYFIP-related Rac1 interactor B-like [Gigantopelta aegis]|uniref:CYFIP-related Rac1 interactor B-like n=1 Tax=Gigantopelta aegis TaxID=1735272 RepID=UPI001B887DCB|nr:CYFIP-related Rac1 interactor B-like [Gigantopelta aegis]
MNNPQIQNDFSYYRRTLNRRKMEDVTMGIAGGSDQLDLPDDVANRMSLFYANPTPILHGLAGATSRLLDENPNITLDHMTECLSTMASVCRVINENPTYKSRFQNEETVIFTLRVMTGAIILYDHVHPVGAFTKKAPIDMKASIKIIREHPKCAEGLINALKYNTKHFNDEATPKATKSLLS